MKNKGLLKAIAIVFALVLTAVNAAAQNGDAKKKEKEPPLNRIRIGHCNQGDLTKLIETERERGLVLDVRPFAINQSTGKLQFNGETGQVSVVHMNPFVYRYDISVAQQELVSSALSDFIDILLPPSLRGIGKAASGRSADTSVLAQIDFIEKRLEGFDTRKCPDAADAGCQAIASMKQLFEEIRKQLKAAALDNIEPPQNIKDFQANLALVRDPQIDAVETCKRAEKLHSSITAEVLDTHFDDLEEANNTRVRIAGLVNDLSQLTTQYLEDDNLKDYPVSCGGFNCARQFNSYAQAVSSILEVYEEKLTELQTVATRVKQVFDLTDKLKNTEGMFARSFTIIKRFELSEATISIKRTEVDKNSQTQLAQNAQGVAATKSSRTPGATGRLVTNHAAEVDEAPAVAANFNNDDDKKADNNKDEPDDKTGQISESIQIGRPRFLVSGGLVYSPLKRQTFEGATGFVRDANGDPTGDGNKNVVNFEENSPRRLLPMVILNTRLASFKPASIYFSLGVTAKHDKDVDVEYLLGPSVSMLNERAMFTFGAYAGKVQNLVPDVKIGDEIPDSAGNASLYTKRYSWKPGFSFSYVFSNVSKRSEEGAGSAGVAANGSAAARDDLSEEIRIGNIPFNLAMGLAYTSVEDRTFDKVLGYARDRQGNLTNGQTLTRIVGLSTSSGSRLVPLAMLHSRLINFGRHSFYLTSGVTGKKTDDNVEIEYLVGGSVNIFRRKMFLTFGAFAGKQQVLGGDLFLGAKLDPTQDVTTHSRYVWKPAFSLSYDISRIMPRSSKP